VDRVEALAGLALPMLIGFALGVLVVLAAVRGGQRFRRITRLAPVVERAQAAAVREWLAAAPTVYNTDRDVTAALPPRRGIPRVPPTADPVPVRAEVPPFAPSTPAQPPVLVAPETVEEAIVLLGANAPEPVAVAARPVAPYAQTVVTDDGRITLPGSATTTRLPWQ
jgi:hypothetical protein